MATGPTWATDVASITADGTTTNYATLQEAFNAVPSNGTESTTITLLASAATDDVISGDGVILYTKDAKNVTLDLNNLTYDVSGKLVGSTGTETQGFHFEKGNTVTIKNGTLKASNTSARILIQNYCSLTLDGVIVDGTDHTYSQVVGINFGSLTTTGSTSINAKAGNQAINVYYGMSSDYYDGITVKIGDGTSISGTIYYTKSWKVTATDWTEKTKVTIDSSVDLTNVGFNYSTDVTPNIAFSDGTKLSDKTYVALVSGSYYTTIDGAFANGTGKTVYILKAGIYTLPDLSNHNMDIDGSKVTDGDVVFDCTTVTNQVTIQKSNFYKVSFKVPTDGLKINSGGTVVFGKSGSSCTFDGTVIVTGKNTSFSYSTFTTTSSEAIRLCNDNDGSTPTVTVNSCTFTASDGNTMPAVMVYATNNGQDLSYTLNVNGTSTVTNYLATADIVKAKSDDGLWGVNAETSTTTKVNKQQEQAYPSLGDIITIVDGSGNALKNYQTLADAYNAVEDGQTIKFLKGYTYDGYKSLGSSSSLNAKAYALDLNGNALKFMQLNIYDNVTITDSSTGGNGSISSTLSGARSVWVNGTVNITGGNLISTEDQISTSNDNAYCTPLVIPKGGACTISGGKVTTDKAYYGAVEVQRGGTLTVNDGAVISTNGTNSNWRVGESGNSAINAESGSTLTINGGNISSKGDAVYAAMYNTNAVNISGGTFTGDKALFAGSYTINITGGTFNGTSYAVYANRPNYADMTQDIKISGGNFTVSGTDGKVIYNASPSSYGTVNIPVTGGYFSDKSSVKDYLAEGYGLFDVDKSAEDYNSSYPYKVGEAEAVIGDTYYKTLAEAITAAEGGQTVTLLKDLTGADRVNISEKALTLDLNKKSISSGSVSPVVYITNGANVNVKNGTITSTHSEGAVIGTDNSTAVLSDLDVSGTFAVQEYNNNSNVTIESGNYSSTEFTVKWYGTGNTLTINDGTFTATDNAVLGGQGNKGFGGNTITINGGKFNGKITTDGYVACGIYSPNDDKITVNGGTFNITNGCGILARAGTVTMGKNVTINTTGTTTGKVGDSRIVVPCSPLVFDVDAGYPGMTTSSEIVVNGGTYKAEGTDVDAIAIVNTKGDTNKRIAVSGGTFSSVLKSDVCATGYAPVTTANSDGLYSVTEDENASSNYIYYTTEKDGQKTFLDGSDITLNDGDYYSFSVPSDMTGKNITYTRNFDYAVWSCWFMPFDIDVTANSNVEFYKLYATLLDDDGEWYISAKKVESGTILANVPYLIKPKDTGEQTFTVTGATVYSTTSSTRPQKTAKVSSVSQDYTFTGIYTKKTTDSDLGWYALAADGNFSQRTQKSDDLALKPFRFFLTITDNGNDPYSSKSSAKPNHTIKIIESGSSTTTGIDETLNGEDNLKDKVIYDLQGRRVTKPVKGLYIVNGKKVIIK